MVPKQVKTQQIHEMKKKEKEYIKLQVGYFLFLIQIRMVFSDIGADI